MGFYIQGYVFVGYFDSSVCIFLIFFFLFFFLSTFFGFSIAGVLCRLASFADKIVHFWNYEAYFFQRPPALKAV